MKAEPGIQHNFKYLNNGDEGPVRFIIKGLPVQGKAVIDALRNVLQEKCEILA